MHFILLMKLRQKPTKEILGQFQKIKASLGTVGKGMFVTLGSYDIVWHIESENINSAMEVALRFSDWASTETLPAITLDEATQIKM